MNKEELVQKITEKTGAEKKIVSETVAAIFDLITEELGKGGSVKMIGFGSFLTRKRNKGVARNFKTGKKITVPATTVPCFRPGIRLKKAVSHK